MLEAYFVRVGPHRFRPTEFTSGAWSQDEQHVSPMTGLMVHELDRFVTDRAARRGPDPLLLSRITYDVLGVAALADFDVHVEVVRPGRTIELLEAVATCAGRPAVRARAWRLSRQDTAEVAGGYPEPLPLPDGFPSRPLSSVWPGGYIASLDVRPVGEPRPGRATVWIHTDVHLVADEPVSALARYITLVDTANGIAVRQSPTTWMFPSIDLSIHLYRQPEHDWVGLDTTVVFGPDGQGLTSTELHDLSGPVGRAEQILTVRPLG
jgi:acyl-CoA thioesterase